MTGDGGFPGVVEFHVNGRDENDSEMLKTG